MRTVDDVISKGYIVFGDIIKYAYPLMQYGVDGSCEFAWTFEYVFDAIEVLKKNKYQF